MEQFLIEGNDKSLSIIYKKSIIVEKVDASLAVGDAVKFLWPENARKQKEFSGIIIGKSEDERVLLRQKDDIVESWKRGNKPNLKRTMTDISKASTSRGNDVLGTKEDQKDVKKRKRAVTELKRDIVREINSNKLSDESKQSQEKNWLPNVIENAKEQAAQDIDSAKIKIMKTSLYDNSDLSPPKLDNSYRAPPNRDNSGLLSPSQGEKNYNKTSSDSKRRSYGMLIDFNDIVSDKDFHDKNAYEPPATANSEDTIGNHSEQYDKTEDTEIINLSSDD